MRPSAKAGGRVGGGREMHQQLAMDHAADEPKPDHDAGRRADGSDVLAIPLLSLLLGARRCFAWRTADLLFSAHDLIPPSLLRTCSLVCSRSASRLASLPTHPTSADPHEGWKAKTEKEEPWCGADSLLLSGSATLVR